ncbi:DEAD/DEAH box helicase [Thermodesulfobacteriota bacterium]
MEDHGFSDFIRIGSPFSVDERLHKNLLSKRVDSYKIDEIKDLRKEVKKCPLIASTTTSVSLSAIIDNLDFNIAVIDEASQIPEPSTFSTITKAKSFIMVGDLYQLGPVMRSTYQMPEPEDRPAGILNLKKTLFERLYTHNKNRYDLEDDNDPVVMLDTQYRMNENIISFSNNKFYESSLKSDDSVKDATLTLKNTDSRHPALANEKPIVFIDSAGKNNSRENKKEATIVCAIIEDLLKSGIDKKDIGVISPFKAQNALIRKMISEHNENREIVIDTVERFQGSERDVIIASFVVGDENGLEFLREDDTLNKKLNVTITRARKKLILIGNKKILANDKIYSELISHIEAE